MNKICIKSREFIDYLKKTPIWDSLTEDESVNIDGDTFVYDNTDEESIFNADVPDKFRNLLGDFFRFTVDLYDKFWGLPDRAARKDLEASIQEAEWVYAESLDADYESMWELDEFRSRFEDDSDFVAETVRRIAEENNCAAEDVDDEMYADYFRDHGPIFVEHTYKMKRDAKGKVVEEKRFDNSFLG